MGDEAIEVTDNAPERRFQAATGAGLAVLEYRVSGGRIDLLHTWVPDEARGRGVAAALVRFALEEARRRGQCVVPTCGYVAGYLRRHPGYQPLVCDG